MRSGFLFVFPTAVLGGAERVMYNIILFLVNKDIKVTVYIMSRGDQEGWDIIKKNENARLIIKEYGSEKTSLIPCAWNILKLSRESDFNYVFSSHSHINGMLSFFRKLRILKTRKLISRESTFVFERYFGLIAYVFRFIYYFMYGSQDLLICQTEKMKKSLIDNLSYNPAKKTCVISNPVNLYDVDQKIKEVIISPFKKTIVTCGRLIDIKKTDDLILAFHEQLLLFPDIGLVIIGTGPNEESLKNMVKTMMIEDKVFFTGKIKNPIAWFAQADIGVISSEIEGFPNVLIEMMAAGTKRVIATPCSDGVYQIPNIIITPSHGVKHLSTALNDALQNPVDDSKPYRKYIEEERSVQAFWDTVVNHLD